MALGGALGDVGLVQAELVLLHGRQGDVVVDLGLVGPHREDGGLVEEVGELGAAVADRQVRDVVEEGAPFGPLVARGPGDLLVARVHLEDLEAVGPGGVAHVDGAVEAAGAQQGVVEAVFAVGGADDEDPVEAREAVHLLEELQEAVLALGGAAVAVARRGPLLPDRVDLVDEDDRGGVLAGGLEEVAHPGGRDPLEHLDKLGAVGAEERDPGLSRHGLCEVGLAGAGRALEEDPARHLGAHVPEALPAHHHLEHLHDVVLHAVDAGDVGKRDARALLLGPRGLLVLHVEALGRRLGVLVRHLLHLVLLLLAELLDDPRPEAEHHAEQDEPHDRDELPSVLVEPHVLVARVDHHQLRRHLALLQEPRVLDAPLGVPVRQVELELLHHDAALPEVSGQLHVEAVLLHLPLGPLLGVHDLGVAAVVLHVVRVGRPPLHRDLHDRHGAVAEDGDALHPLLVHQVQEPRVRHAHAPHRRQHVAVVDPVIQLAALLVELLCLLLHRAQRPFVLLRLLIALGALLLVPYPQGRRCERGHSHGRQLRLRQAPGQRSPAELLPGVVATPAAAAAAMFRPRRSCHHSLRAADRDPDDPGAQVPHNIAPGSCVSSNIDGCG